MSATAKIGGVLYTADSIDVVSRGRGIEAAKVLDTGGGVLVYPAPRPADAGSKAIPHPSTYYIPWGAVQEISFYRLKSKK